MPPKSNPTMILPKEKIYSFLKNIIEKENLGFSREKCYEIIDLYKCDVRSMINDLQNLSFMNKLNIITAKDIQNFLKNMEKRKSTIIHEYLNTFNIEKYQLVIYIFNYLVKHNPNKSLFRFMEDVLHTNNYNITNFDTYFITNLKKSINS